MTGFSSRCLVPGCGWSVDEPTKDIAGCMATWHVYERHPRAWARIAGHRLPVDPDPRIPQVREYLLSVN